MLSNAWLGYLLPSGGMWWCQVPSRFLLPASGHQCPLLSACQCLPPKACWCPVVHTGCRCLLPSAYGDQKPPIPATCWWIDVNAQCLLPGSHQRPLLSSSQWCLLTTSTHCMVSSAPWCLLPAVATGAQCPKKFFTFYSCKVGILGAAKALSEAISAPGVHTRVHNP